MKQIKMKQEGFVASSACVSCHTTLVVNSRFKCVTFQDLEDEEQFSDEEYEKFQKEYHEKIKVSILCS